MILITGQKAIMSAKQARFQIVDIVASMKPLTKMTRQIVSVASIPAMVRDAFRVAMEERPGPVHLELPEDIAGEEIEDVPVVPVHPLERPLPILPRSIGQPRCHPGRQAAAGHDRRGRQPAVADRVAVRVRVGARGCRSSTRRWARAPSPAAPTSTWVRPRCQKAIMSTRLSTAPT
jgi:hypothetical protein